MKIDSRRSDVAVSGMVNQRAFTVKAGAHIMAVLSNLYKDPVDAMVREYLTNMADAYVALRKVNPSAPFRAPELHIPSRMDGNLTFTDFGIGMSLEQVWNVYSTYGETTKGDDNDEVGGFGLGSKTAFCYNGGASWMIVSRKDNTKNVFTAFIGEDGVPNLTHVSSDPTDEPSGMTISIPIRRDDVGSVREAVEKYAPYFPMELVITGSGSDMVIQAPEYHLRSDKWGFQKARGYGNRTARVIMGNVPYPVDYEHFKVKGTDYYEFNTFLQSNRIDLFVPIGSVNIVPSRDSLMYTDLTVATIQSALKSMRQELADQLAKQVAGCKTEWEAVLQMKVIDEIGAVSFVPNVKWNGTVISARAVERTWPQVNGADPTSTGTAYDIDGGNSAKIEVIPFDPSTVIALTPDELQWLIIDDMPTGGATIARSVVYNACVQKSGGRTRRWGHKSGTAYLIRTKLSKAQLSDLFGGMPVDLIKTVSELKGTVVVPTAARVTKDTIYRWSGSSWQARVNIPTGQTTYYYLPLTKSGARYSYENGRYSQKDTMRYVTQYAAAFNMNTSIIYGVKSGDSLKLPKNWVNVEDAIKAETLRQAKLHTRELALVESGISDSAGWMYALIVGIELGSINPMFSQYVADVTEIESAKQNKIVNTIIAAGRTLDDIASGWADLVAAEKVPDLHEQIDQIFKSYPMLQVVLEISNRGYYRYNRGASDWTQYKKSILDYCRSM